jgi:hypothetical protein
MPNITSETLALFKEALASDDPSILAKAWVQPGSATSGLTTYPLEIPAKELVPYPSPLRNSIPRVSMASQGGIQAAWRAITGVDAAGMDWSVAEGKRGGITTTTTADYLAAYRGIGGEDSVTFEAEYAGDGFEVRAKATTRLLETVMSRGEEPLILGGLGTWGLGTTPTPVGVLVINAGDMTPQATLCFVVALTLAGYRRSTVAGGLPGQITRTNADSSTDTVNGGNAKVSLVSNTVTTTGANLSVVWSVAAVPGAVAYAWYTGPTGASTCSLTAITTANTFTQTADAVGTQKANDAKVAVADYSQNSLAFDGLLSIAMKSGSNSYYKSLDGAALTSDNAGGIVEWDAALASFYGTGAPGSLLLSPNEVWVSAQDTVKISALILHGNATVYPFFQVGITDGQTTVNGGGKIVPNYLNKITSDQIAIRVHPYMPSGTNLFVTRTLPYPLSGVGDVMRILTRQEYYQIDWPLVTRKRQFGVYADEVLQHYFPPSLGVVANGTLA